MALFSLISLNVATQTTMLADSFSLPASQYIYSWQEPGLWELEIFSTFKYRDDALTDTNVNYYQEGGDPFNRIIYTYDTNQRLTGRTVQNFQSVFVNNALFEYEYDDHDNLTKEIYNIWFSNDWQPATGSRSGYLYQGDTLVTLITRESFNVLQGWLNDERTEFLFNGNAAPEEITVYEFVDFSWIPTRRTHGIEWQSYDGEHATGEYLQYQYDTYMDGEWIPEKQRNYDWFLYGSHEFIEQEYRGDDLWMNALRYREDWAPEGRILEVRYDDWNGLEWKQVNGYTYEYTMEGIDLTEVLIKVWDTVSMAYVHSERIVFTDFVHFLAVRESPIRPATLKAYPNPATDWVVVDLGKTEADELLVTDIQGRTCFQALSAGNHSSVRIDISNLLGGMFFIKAVKNGRTVGSGRILKAGR